MEQLRYRLILSLLILFSLQTKASYRTEVYSAYINNKMVLWKNVIDRMDSVPAKSNEMLLELINYQYGYIGYCIEFDQKEEAKEYLDLAQINVGILEKYNYNLSAVNSYKAAFYGFRIELNPLSAPVNGFKSIDCAKSALKLDPEYYLGYIQYGNLKFHMPPAFGGSKKEALEHYLKAREIMEKDPESVHENWNYMSLLIIIAQSYASMKDYTSARKVFERILELEPGFIYVKDDLYPNLLKKMSGTSANHSTILPVVIISSIPATDMIIKLI